jgi:hypothetical protein
MKIGKDFDQYERVNELRAELEMGLEIEFRYQGRVYWFTPLKDGYLCYEANVENTDQIFPTFDAMLDGLLLDGQPLRQLVTALEVTLH